MTIKSFDDAHDFFPADEQVTTGFFAKLRLIWLAFTDRGNASPITTGHAVSEVYPGR